MSSLQIIRKRRAEKRRAALGKKPFPKKEDNKTYIHKEHDEITKHISKKTKSKNDFFGVSGVYYLIRGRKVIYIGESSCVYSRLSQHYKEGIKDFDTFAIERVDGEQKRKQYEKRQIQRFRPVCNSVHNPNLK